MTGVAILPKGSPAKACDADAPSRLKVYPAYAHSFQGPKLALQNRNAAEEFADAQNFEQVHGIPQMRDASNVERRTGQIRDAGDHYRRDNQVCDRPLHPFCGRDPSCFLFCQTICHVVSPFLFPVGFSARPARFLESGRGVRPADERESHNRTSVEKIVWLFRNTGDGIGAKVGPKGKRRSGFALSSCFPAS